MTENAGSKIGGQWSVIRKEEKKVISDQVNSDQKAKSVEGRVSTTDNGLPAINEGQKTKEKGQGINGAWKR
jgi:hypothetical protein